MTLPICHWPQSIQLKSPIISVFSRPPIPALHFSTLQLVLILWQDTLIFPMVQVTPNGAWNSKAAWHDSSCFPGWACTSHPLPTPLVCSSAAVILRWALAGTLWERMICSASAWKNTEYIRRVVFFRCRSKRKEYWRRNKNNAFVHALSKK